MRRKNLSNIQGVTPEQDEEIIELYDFKLKTNFFIKENYVRKIQQYTIGKKNHLNKPVHLTHQILKI